MGQRLIGGWGDGCRRCGLAFRPDEFPTRLYVAEDCDGQLGLSGAFHDQCAVPLSAYAAPAPEQARAQ